MSEGRAMGGLRTLQMGMGWQGEQAGGLNRFFIELLQHLPAEGVAVQGLVAGGGRAASESGGMVRDFASTTASMWHRISAARRAVGAAVGETGGALGTAVATDRAVLVSHFAPYGAAMLGAARTLPFVVYFHGPWADESRAEGRGWFSGILRNALERRVYRRADACIVLSRAFGALLAERYGVASDRIHLIPGGVECSRYDGLPSRALARQALGWDPAAPTLLAVRRLVKRTGVDRLIAAVPAIRAAVPGVQVCIAGEGSERPALQAQAQALGLGDAVRFLGFVDEPRLPLAYRAADLTLVPSVALEGFGLIVPESLAAGTPVLVTPVGGLPETVEGLSRELILRDSSPMRSRPVRSRRYLASWRCPARRSARPSRARATIGR